MELKKEFDGKGEVRGYHFKQIIGGDNGFIYEVTSGGRSHYEVFKRMKKSYPSKDGGRIEYLAYPRSNDFGIWAWTCDDIARAYQVYQHINQQAVLKEQST